MDSVARFFDMMEVRLPDRGRDGTGVILEFLARGPVPDRGIGVVVENDETGTAV